MIFFSNAANIMFDINFVIQIALIALLIFGAIQKPNRRRHGTIMAIATIVNLATLAIIMLPAFFMKWTLIGLHNLTAIMIIHAIVGGVAIAIGLIFSIRFLIFLSRNKDLNCGTKMGMRIVNLSWLVSFVLGLIFYFVFYTTAIA
jgi:hypothetical protein